MNIADGRQKPLPKWELQCGFMPYTLMPSTCNVKDAGGVGMEAIEDAKQSDSMRLYLAQRDVTG